MERGAYEVRVNLSANSYSIDIGSGLLARLGSRLQSLGYPRRVALISNPTVAAHYLEGAERSLREAGMKVTPILLPDGEEHKNIDTLMQIYTELIRHGFDRHCGLIALGGGVIGDMVGFAASTYLRGVPFVQVPTTLLAQVDSSVGGKTGINHPLGKNLIGAFCQPRHVLIDVATLATLPEREYAAGLAEVVKYGVIRDYAFFVWLEKEREKLKNRSPDALVHAVKTACQIKANVVEIDEREESLRAILNYGHTFGHAVENLAGYGTFLHGEAVAVGMVVAASLSCRNGLCRADEVARIVQLLKGFGLPVQPPTYSLADYLAAMARDKKVRDGAIRFVLNSGLGDCRIESLADVGSQLEAVLAGLHADGKG